MSQEISTETQRYFLEMMLANPDCYVRVQNIYNPDNFDRSLKPAAKFIGEYVAQYRTMPGIDLVSAETDTHLKQRTEKEGQQVEWLMTNFEAFTKRKELERAILKSADMLEKGDFSPVEKLIKDAVQISLTKDLGTDYFADPRIRLEKYFNSGGQVSTGWPSLDKVLYGGFSRGELNIFAGGSGSGKSLFMMNIALSWLQQGLNGVYVSLELSEELCGLRTDAMLTGISTKGIRKDIDETALRVATTGKKYGKYRIKALPAQSTINDIRAFLKEYETQMNIKVDFMMVDYLDLLMPVSAKVSPNDLFVKDKYVSEELRNLSKELGVLLVTASQLNRSAVEEVEFDHSHISGGISKINTADNVFGIFTSRAMRERGRYQIQCLKTRSSTGVGMKVDLDYDIETMRITDPGEEAQGAPGQLQPQSTSVFAQLKAKSQVKPAESSDNDGSTEFKRATGTPAWEQPAKVGGGADSTKLRQMLAGLKSTNQ